MIFVSPSLRRTVCSEVRWLMTGSEIPPIITGLCSSEVTILVFKVTSPLKCTVGVISISTPTSRY